jgi:plasmid stability protein
MMSNDVDKKKPSEVLYHSIANGKYDLRLKESLRQVKEVCDEIEKHGGRIYVSRVGNLCEEKFKGPVAQSIRNKPDMLKRFVELRAAEQKISIEKDHRTVLQKILQKISDPMVRSFVILQNETIKDLEEQIRRLNKAIASISPMEIDKMLASASAGSNRAELPVAEKADDERNKCLGLNEVVCRALVRLTSEDELKLCGLRLHNGHVLTSTNYKLLDKEELSELKNLLRDEKNFNNGKRIKRN